MFLTTHAAAGLVISQYVHNPYAVFGLSFASHFVLDFIPHGDENIYGTYELPGSHHRFRRAVVINFLDLAALGGLTMWAIAHQSANQANDRLMLIGILGGILPDFLSNLFPILHEKLSWLALVRWVYAITKPTGIRYLVRGQNWIHNVLHHEIFRRDIPFWAGLMTQVVLVAAGILLLR